LDITTENSIRIQNTEPSVESALEHLYTILDSYMNTHSNLSTNNMSKRCGISEPTLRRIRKRQLKKLPNTTTVLKLLSYISQKNSIHDVLDHFKGDLTSLLRPSMTYVIEKQVSDVTDLTEALDRPLTYLIYKLAAATKGVSKQKVQDMFGDYGLQEVKRCVNSELIFEEEGVFHAKHKKFTLGPENFVDNLKATANFIKVDNLGSSPFCCSQLFYNCSNSVNLKAYEDILKVNRAAIKKIQAIFSDPKSTGDIPVFAIGAVDSLDTKSAFEISKEI